MVRRELKPQPTPTPELNGFHDVVAEGLRLHGLDVPLVMVREGKNKDGTDIKGPRFIGWEKVVHDRTSLTNALSIPGTKFGIILSRTGWVDVECDNEAAETEYQRLVGAEIVTPTYKSKKGYHRYFLRPAGCPDKAKLVVNGIEFRGLSTTRAAQSLVPPSVTDGFKREWVHRLGDVEVAEMPAPLVALLMTDPKADNAATQTTQDVKDGPDKWTEGTRNDNLFRYGCKVYTRVHTFPESLAMMIAALLTKNEEQCQPPLSKDEVVEIAKNACKYKPDLDLLGIAEKESELWHTPDGTAHATIQMDGHKENHPVDSSAYRKWLAWRCWQETGKALGDGSATSVLAALEGKALFEGKEHRVHIRVAGHEGRVYVDLCDPQWRAVEIDSTGWRIVTDPPVRFRRAKGALALPDPVHGGSLKDLRRFVNVTDEQWALFVGWVVGAHPGQSHLNPEEIEQ
jgi:hypothetical protein